MSAFRYESAIASASTATAVPARLMIMVRAAAAAAADISLLSRPNTHANLRRRCSLRNGGRSRVQQSTGHS
jgi:hypothetical protein